MKPFSCVTSRAVRLLERDIDTDQLVPARFLRTNASEGFGRWLFYDRRFNVDGTTTSEFPLNPPAYKGESILLAGDNFGCGSSREHAPWALLDFGIKVVIAPSFGDIFRANCTKNGLLTITLPAADYKAIVATDAPLDVDLEQRTIRTAGWSCGFAIDPFDRFCLLDGVSPSAYIRRYLADIETFERQNGGRSCPPGCFISSEGEGSES